MAQTMIIVEYKKIGSAKIIKKYNVIKQKP